MADTTVGQAIALGNLARPDTTKVFTNAVMRGQEMNLRRRKMEQEEAAKQKQLQSEFAKMLDFGKGGFLPIYQEQATNLTSSALAEMYKKQQAGDVIGASAIRQDAKRRLEDLYAENEQFKAWQGTARQGGLITPDVLEITNMPFSQAKQKYDKLVAEKPETKEILMFDEQNRRFVPRPIKEIDYNSILNSTTSNLLANSSTPVYSKRGDLIRYDYNVSDDAIASRGNELAANEDLRVNIIVRRPKDVKTEFDNIVAQQKIDINVPEQREFAKIQAVSNVIQKDIKANVDKTRFTNAPSGSRGTLIVPSTSQGEGYKIKVLHPNKEGVEQEYTSTAKYSSQLELTKGAINSNLLKDAKTGNPYQTDDLITNIKTAVVSVLPIYKQGAIGKDSSGKQYSLGGRVVDDSNLTPEKANVYEWKPVVVGITDSDEQVLVEFDNQNNIMNTLKKGNIGRQAQTQYDIDQAFKVANEANRKKDATKPAVKTKVKSVAAPKGANQKKGTSGIVDKNL